MPTTALRSLVLPPTPTSISSSNSKNQTRILFRVPQSSKPTFSSHHSSLQSANTTKSSISCSQFQNSSESSSHSRQLEYIPNHIPDPNYVRIFDTTLCDGKQSPGTSLSSKEKLEIACQLAKLGVDIIEVGFPAASNDDFKAVKKIAMEVGNVVDDDSAIHMEYKLRKTKEQVIEIARNMAKFARSLGCEDVEFSPEDAGRSDREFLHQIIGEVIKVGAMTLNIPDTASITMPSEFGKLIADMKANTFGIENGACVGARQLEVTN